MSKPTSTSNNCVLTAEIELENQELCGELEPNNVLEVFIENGARGKSAYEVWIDEGNTGTQQDFLNSLRPEAFIHEQIFSQNEWEVGHNLNKFPSVTIVDSGNNIVIGNVEYIDKNNVIIRFSSEFSGKAYLN